MAAFTKDFMIFPKDFVMFTSVWRIIIFGHNRIIIKYNIEDR